MPENVEYACDGPCGDSYCGPKSMNDLINCAYAELMEARKQLHEVSEIEYRRKAFLKEKETGLLMSGAIIGKNAESRAAELLAATKQEAFDVEVARQEKMVAALRMDLAQMRCEQLKWLIRADAGTQEA
jgi:hypothetical protein